MIKAASEVTAKGYAKVTLLGDPQQVAAEAKKLGADISGCTIVDPKVWFGGGGSRYGFAVEGWQFDRASSRDNEGSLKTCFSKARKGRGLPETMLA